AALLGRLLAATRDCITQPRVTRVPVLRERQSRDQRIPVLILKEVVDEEAVPPQLLLHGFEEGALGVEVSELNRVPARALGGQVLRELGERCSFLRGAEQRRVVLVGVEARQAEQLAAPERAAVQHCVRLVALVPDVQPRLVSGIESVTLQDGEPIPAAEIIGDRGMLGAAAQLSPQLIEGSQYADAHVKSSGK